MADRNYSVKLSANVDAYTTAMAKATASTEKLSSTGTRSFAQLGGQMSRVGGQTSRNVSLPIIAAGGAAVKMAMDWDTSFSRMVGLAGVAADEVDDLKAKVLELAGRTAQAPAALADALYQASSSGLDTASAMAAVEVAAEGAAAGMGSAADIVSLVASATASYGAANITAAEATDILTATIREGRADPAELAGSMGQLMPAAAKLGVSFGELGGAVAYMSNVSGNTAGTITQMRGILLTLLSPTQQGKDALVAMGTSAEELKSAIASDGLMGALELLRSKGFEGNQDALRDLFTDSEAFLGISGLMAADQEKLAGTIDATTHAVGSLDTALDAARGTDAFKMSQAINDMKIAMVQAGAVILPIVAGVAGAFGDLASVFADLPKGAQQIVVSFLSLAAVAGPLISVTGKLLTNWDRINTSLAAHPAATAKAAGAMAVLGTAIIGVTMYTQKMNDEHDRMMDTFARLSEVADAEVLARFAAEMFITGVEGHKTANVLEQLARTNLDGAKRVRDLTQARIDDGTATEHEIDVQNQLIAAIQYEEKARLEATQAANRAKLSTDDMSKSLAAQSERWTALAQSLEPVTEDLELTEEQLKANADATDALKSSLDPLVTAFDVLASHADTVNSALQRVIGGHLDMETATRGLMDRTREIDEVFKKNGATLDMNTAKGSENRAVVQSQVEGIVAYSEAMVAGGKSVDDVTGTMDYLRQGLINQMTAWGLTTDEATAYVDQLGLTPDNIRTGVELANAEITRERLQAMIEDLGVLDEGTIAEIQALVDTGSFSRAEALINHLMRMRTMPVSIAYATVGEHGVKIPGHADGGYISGPMLSTLGEGGLPEVVLPLTKPGRMRQLLADPRVGGPVFAAAGPTVASANGRVVNLVHTTIPASASAAPVQLGASTGSTVEDQMAAQDELQRRMYERNRISLTQYRAYLNERRASMVEFSDDEDAKFRELQALDDEERRMREDAAQLEEDAAAATLERTDRIMAYMAETNQISLADYKAYLDGRRSAFEYATVEWFAWTDRIAAAQRSIDQGSLDMTKRMFDAADAAKELSDAQRANQEADAARTAAGVNAWAVSKDRTKTDADRAAANEAFIRSEEQLAESALRLADALANAQGLADGTTEWAASVRQRLGADIAWNANNGRTGVADALQRELLGVPSFAVGGYVGPSAGGTLVRVAEAGQGEFMVPADKMRDLTSASAGGGVVQQTTININIDAPLSYDGDRAAQDMLRHINRHLRSNGHAVIGGRG
jgi:TP901 family phage tail tape measure protein